MQPLRTMTLGDFRSETSGLPDETLLVMEYDYGDYHHTRAVNPIGELLEGVRLVESGYSASGYAINDPDEDDDEQDEPITDEELATMTPEQRANYDLWLAERQEWLDAPTYLVLKP